MVMDKIRNAINSPAAAADPYELSPFENLATTVPESIDDITPAVADKMSTEPEAELAPIAESESYKKRLEAARWLATSGYHSRFVDKVEGGRIKTRLSLDEMQRWQGDEGLARADRFKREVYAGKLAVGLEVSRESLRPLFGELAERHQSETTLTRFMLGHAIGDESPLRAGKQLVERLATNLPGLLAEETPGHLSVADDELLQEVLAKLPEQIDPHAAPEEIVPVPEPVIPEPVTELAPVPEPIVDAKPTLATPKPVAKPKPKVPKDPPAAKKPGRVTQLVGAARFKFAELTVPAVSPAVAYQRAKTRGASFRGLHIKTDGDELHVVKETKKGVTLLERTADGRVNTVHATRKEVAAVVRKQLALAKSK